MSNFYFFIHRNSYYFHKNHHYSVKYDENFTLGKFLSLWLAFNVFLNLIKKNIHIRVWILKIQALFIFFFSLNKRETLSNNIVQSKTIFNGKTFSILRLTFVFIKDMPNKTHYINFNVFECQTFVLQLQKHKFEEEFYDLIFTQPDDMQHNEYLNLQLYLIH